MKHFYIIFSVCILFLLSCTGDDFSYDRFFDYKTALNVSATDKVSSGCFFSSENVEYCAAAHTNKISIYESAVGDFYKYAFDIQLPINDVVIHEIAVKENNKILTIAVVFVQSEKLKVSFYETEIKSSTQLKETGTIEIAEFANTDKTGSVIFEDSTLNFSWIQQNKIICIKINAEDSQIIFSESAGAEALDSFCLDTKSAIFTSGNYVYVIDSNDKSKIFQGGGSAAVCKAETPELVLAANKTSKGSAALYGYYPGLVMCAFFNGNNKAENSKTILERTNCRVLCAQQITAHNKDFIQILVHDYDNSRLRIFSIPVYAFYQDR